jgi:hypothetical protein
MNFDGLFAELKRRHVVRVAVSYVIVGWIIIEVGSTIFPALGVPAWGATLLVTLTLLGFPLALVLAWAFDVTPQGLRRTGSARRTVRPGTVHRQCTAHGAPRHRAGRRRCREVHRRTALRQHE